MKEICISIVVGELSFAGKKETQMVYKVKRKSNEIFNIRWMPVYSDHTRVDLDFIHPLTRVCLSSLDSSRSSKMHLPGCHSEVEREDLTLTLRENQQPKFVASVNHS